MPPDAPRQKINLKPTDTSRLKTKTSSSVPKAPPVPDKPAVPPLPPAATPAAAPAPAQQTTMLTDPLTLRDTDASKLKRVKLDSQQPVAASAISPAVGLGRDKRDTTDTVHLKVIREKRKEVPGVGLVSQTVRLRPATKSPETAGEQPDAATASVAPTPRPLPEPPPPARPSIKMTSPAAPSGLKPLVPKAPPVEAPAEPAAPTEEENADNKVRTTTIKVRSSAGLKPLPTPGAIPASPATPPMSPPMPPVDTAPEDATLVASEPALAAPTEEENADNKIRTTTVKLRPSAGLKPLPAPGTSFATTSTMAVPAPSSAPAVPATPPAKAKPVSGHTIKIKTLGPPAATVPAVPVAAATVPATPPEKPTATVALPAAPETPAGGTVKMAAAAPTSGQAKKTLKLKAPVAPGEAAISLEQDGLAKPDAAARETAAGTDMLSFAFSALTAAALIALVGILAKQVQLFVF